jgi:hypothetical protein
MTPLPVGSHTLTVHVVVGPRSAPIFNVQNTYHIMVMP